jgi:hypothetical protein
MDTMPISKLKATCLERLKRACHVPVAPDEADWEVLR